MNAQMLFSLHGQRCSAGTVARTSSRVQSGTDHPFDASFEPLIVLPLFIQLLVFLAWYSDRLRWLNSVLARDTQGQR